VPLAFIVFGATSYLSVWAVRVRRQSSSGVLDRAADEGLEPKADVHHVTAPVVPVDSD
jgi:hypothetical protein